MFKLNKSTRIALYSIFELSKNPKEKFSASQIADKYDISEHHVIKVLQQLARAGFVKSSRGINGGFQISLNPKNITMFDVVQIFEPSQSETKCSILETNETCKFKNATCSIGTVINEIKEQADFTLKSITIATLIAPKKIF
ncbi:MAG: Rrf2 family transcriptional regulator [Calditrichaeota bacterium]|nr:MAG: Rrf2 family transcriptional regulator [Calditrichota bacterium]